MINPIKYNGEILSHVARVGVDGGTVENPEILNYDLETSLQATESFILDNNLNTAFAYSFRKLSSNYQGPCVRIRRSNDNVETDIFFSNNVLDEAALLTFVGGFNAHIVTWYDQTGKGNHLVQLTAANQPKIVVSGVIQRDNGNIVALFDNNVQSFNLTTPYTFTADTFSKSVVKRYIENFNVLDFINESSWSADSTIRTTYYTNNFRYYGPSEGNQFINSTNRPISLNQHNEILINKFGGLRDDNISQYVYYVRNNIPPSSVNINRDQWTNLTLHSPTTRINTVNNNYTYTLSEVIYWNSDISNQLTNIRENTNRFYNLYWNGSQNSILNEFSGAAAAYSLRALNSNYTGPLVKVRRSSDNLETDIYALRDGSLDINGLTNFVGTQNFALNSETIGSWSLNGVVINSNVINSPDGTLTADLFTNTVNGSYILQLLDLTTGQIINFSWYVKKNISSTLSYNVEYHQSGANTTTINFNFDTGIISGGIAESVGNGWWRLSCSTTITSNRNQIRIVNNTTDSFYLWGLQLTQSSAPVKYNRTTTAVAGNGFITTWYDQSGNSRNAVQTTAANQPQIVSSGGLILENQKPSLSFDGVNDSLFFNGNFLGGSAGSGFAICKFDNSTRATRDIIYGLQDTINTRYDFLITRQASNAINIPNAIDFYVEGNFDASNFTITDTTQHLYSNIYVNNNLRNLWVNGVLAYFSSVNNLGNLDDGTNFIIGADIDGSSYLDGEIQEIIIYPSNQSQNRTRIETNINQYYNIYWNGTKAGILDSYPSSAAAYSLRALSSTYTGPLVRVRRASDNVESDFYALYDGGLDVIGLSNFCVGTDGFVATWYDQSGNGRNATQATAANQPQIVASGSVLLDNGKPEISLDGVNDFLSFTPQVATSTHFISLVAGGTTKGRILGNISNYAHFLESGSIENRYRINKVITNLNSRILQHQSLLSWNRVTTSSIIYQNNIINTNSTVSSDNFEIGQIGANTNDVTTISNGYIQEFIMYSSNQTNNRAKIESNINRYYNIYWDGSVRGILDSYPNSAAAYSLRALSSTYTGPLIKVRRASDNLETDVYARYNGDLDAVALTSFCSGTNGFVTTWYDQSGNNRNAVQTTASNQPQIVASGSVILEGGKPTILFDGVNDFLRSVFGTTLSNNLTFIAAFRLLTLPSAFKNIYGNSGDRVTTYVTMLNRWNIFNGSVVTNNIAAQTIKYISYTMFDGVNDIGYMNNNLIASGDATSATVSTDNLDIATATGASNRNINVNYYELILYNSNQNSNRLGIENNINRYYNIY